MNLLDHKDVWPEEAIQDLKALSEWSKRHCGPGTSLAMFTMMTSYEQVILLLVEKVLMARLRDKDIPYKFNFDFEDASNKVTKEWFNTWSFTDRLNYMMAYHNYGCCENTLLDYGKHQTTITEILERVSND